MRRMAQRTVRLNELLQREISAALHAGWQGESVRITISGVDVSPDLRNAIIFYSVVGGDTDRADARKLLTRIKSRLRHNVSLRMTMKYHPEYRFMYDESSARGTHLVDLLDRVADEDKKRDERAKSRDEDEEEKA